MSDPITRLNASLADRYCVECELGRGGMATVYLADDLKHGRKVALKVLKPELAAVVGADRFLAEIRTTANLQHPNILPLFDSGEADSFLYYVMPYVNGESLRAKLDRERQLPIDEAVRIATGILHALDHAHHRGVVHRDIKPENILLQDGQPVVADFGIALAVHPDAARLTETGLSVGTPQYMSPEQATGDQFVGPATDLWAVGCVLHEMLVGEPPHTGGTPLEILGKIISSETEPVTERRRATPPNVSAAVTKALELLPADRFSSAVRFADALADPGFRLSAEPTSARPPRSMLRAAVASMLVLGGVAVGLGVRSIWNRPAEVAGSNATQTVRFRIEGHYSHPLGRLVAISPDGRHIAHSAGSRLAVRRLDRSDEPVELHADAQQPFFSPDGEQIGFFGGVGTTLMRIPIAGGSPSIVAAGQERPLGGTWGTDNTIVFATTLGLYRVPSRGGQPELLAAPRPEEGELYYAWPERLPGAHAVLFTIVPQETGSDAQGVIAALNLESGERTILVRGGSGARYAATGHLIYSAGAQLHATRFDSDELEVAGDPVSLGIDGLTLASGSGPDFDISGNGTLVYVPAMVAGSALRNLAWVDRQGKEELLSAPPRRYSYPRISPDGTRIAMDILGPRDIYVWDIERQSLDRLIDHPGEDFFAEWSPDGRRVYFNSNRNGPFNIFSRAADGTGSDELVHATPATQMLNYLSPVGDLLLVAQLRHSASDFDLVALTTQEPVRSHTVLSTTNQELNGVISPAGKWVAYQTDASGQWEVYVGPFADLAQQRWKVSIDGGAQPLWSRTGDELFYRAPGGAMMSVAVRLTPSFEVGKVTELFRLAGQGYSATTVSGRSYDVSPLDGRFLMTRPAGSGEGNGITVILNWLGELAQRVPTR